MHFINIQHLSLATEGGGGGYILGKLVLIYVKKIQIAVILSSNHARIFTFLKIKLKLAPFNCLTLFIYGISSMKTACEKNVFLHVKIAEMCSILKIG